jgi:transposase
VNEAVYKSILEEYLLPEIRSIEWPMIFMQDNAPAHTCQLVKDFLHSVQLPVLNWPPQSPDLNPIENIWAIMKQKLYHDFPTPTS